MGFYSKILEYRRLVLILIVLALGHLILVAAAAVVIVRYQVLWAIPAVLWLPLIIIALRTATGWLKDIFTSRDQDLLKANGVTAEPLEDPAQKKILADVAGEIAIATGEDEPDVAVCQSPGINAFMSRSGKYDGREVVVFTSGMASVFNRQELQSAVANLHAHRRNFDKMFAGMVGAMYISVFAAADFFLLLATLNWHYGGSGDFSTGPLVVILVLGMVFGPVLAAGYAEVYIMRRSRFLDDLETLKTTNDPESLMGALTKSGAAGERLAASYDFSNAHLYFDQVTDPARKFPWQRLATHPTAAARVQALKAATGSS